MNCALFKMLVKCEKLCSLSNSLPIDFPKLDLYAFGVNRMIAYFSLAFNFIDLNKFL